LLLSLWQFWKLFSVLPPLHTSLPATLI
jgi:hypothetical protein